MVEKAKKEKNEEFYDNNFLDGAEVREVSPLPSGIKRYLSLQTLRNPLGTPRYLIVGVD